MDGDGGQQVVVGAQKVRTIKVSVHERIRGFQIWHFGGEKVTVTHLATFWATT